MGLLALSLSLPPTGIDAAGADAPFKRYEATLIGLDAAPKTQTGDLDCAHEVGEAIRIGSHPFPVLREDGRLRVATAPGGEPDQFVAEGKTLELEWMEGETRRSVSVGFSVREDGTWLYYAAMRARVRMAGGTVNLVDANCDGVYGDIRRDGWFPDDTFLVLPLADSIHVGSWRIGIKEIESDGSGLTASVVEVPGTASQLKALELLNHLRAANGLSPVGLDPVLSDGCTQHAEYLKLNSWANRGNPHNQDLGPKGRSGAGLTAAMRSEIGPYSPEVAIRRFWSTYFRRIELQNPRLDRIGVNATPTSLCVLDDRSRGDGGGHWTRPVSVPADGAVGVPMSAIADMAKNEATNSDSRGFPIVVWLPWAASVTDTVCSLHLLRGSRAIEVRALPVVGSRTLSYECIGLMPAAKLKGRSTYRATFTWQRYGTAEEKRIEFKTR